MPPPPSQSHIPGPLPPGALPQFPTATFEFHPTLLFEEAYTDNFNVTSRGRTENFRSTLGAGFNLLINMPRTKGSVSTSMNASHDSAGDEDYNLFPTLTMAVRHEFSPRLGLTLTDSLTRSDEPSQGDQFGLRRERSTFTSNTFGAAVDWLIDVYQTQYYYRLGTFFSDSDTTSHVLGTTVASPIGPLMTGRVGYEFSRSETSGVTDSESTGHLGLASLSRQVGQYAQVGVSTSYSIQSRADTRIWNAQLFTAYGLPTGLSTSGSIGYSLLNSDTQDNLSTLSTSTVVSYRFVRAVVSVGIFKDFRQTFVEGQDFGVVKTTSYTGSFLYQLTPFISTTLSLTYSENEGTGSGSQRDQSSDTFTATAGLSWQLLHWLAMNLSYSYIDRSGGFTSTTGSSADTTENRASLRLSATF